MKQLSWIRHEMRLQWKNGMYVVYIFVNLVYLFLLGYIPAEYKDMAIAVIIFSDPTFLGMLFVGGIFLLEKNQGIPAAIGISPLGGKGYILGKVISLLTISLITAYVLIVVNKGSNFNFLGVLLSVGLSGSIFTMIGIILGTYAKGTNSFLMLFSIMCLPLTLPVITYYNILPLAVLKCIPTYATLKLINEAIVGQQISVVDVIYLVIWLGITYKLTKQVVEKKIFVG